MTRPRETAPSTGAGRGASSSGGSGPPRLLRAFERQWERLRRTRPMRTISRFTDVGGGVLAAGMSYQALFAVFAGLYVGFGAVGIWLQRRPDLLDQLIEQLNLLVPGLVGSGGLVSEDALLSIEVLSITSAAAALSLLWIAITWFTGTRRSIRLIFGLDVKEYRNPLLLKLRDFLLALAFFVAILVSAGLTLLSTNLMDGLIEWLGWDPENWLVSGLGSTARYGAMYVFDVIVLVGIHRFLAEIRVGRWTLLRGCAVGGAALFGLKILGTVLLGGASSNPLLATFSVLIGLLIWFNLVCRVLLLTASWVAVGADRTLALPET